MSGVQVSTRDELVATTMAAMYIQNGCRCLVAAKSYKRAKSFLNAVDEITDDGVYRRSKSLVSCDTEGILIALSHNPRSESHRGMHGTLIIILDPEGLSPEKRSSLEACVAPNGFVMEVPNWNR